MAMTGITVTDVMVEIQYNRITTILTKWIRITPSRKTANKVTVE